MTSDPVFPVRLYIYNREGFYGEPIMIFSEAQLNGPGTVMIIRHAVESGVEVVMTDPLDFCVFHAKGGEVLFPERGKN